MDLSQLELHVDGIPIRLAYLQRNGSLPPLVSVHGFGSTKEDYADLAMRDDFQDRALIFWDAPGFGESEISDPEMLTIPFLVRVALAAMDALGVERFHVSGHSMGGLTALCLAHEHKDRVLSFMNIEGNLAPEDCFLTRQIIEHPADSPEGVYKRVYRPGTAKVRIRLIALCRCAAGQSTRHLIQADPYVDGRPV